MKRELCKAFCEQLNVRAVKAGLAISTGFTLSDLEPLGFYVTGPDNMGRFRIEDDGTTMPMIEAAGIDLESKTRKEALDQLLGEYGASYDADSGELKSLSMPEDEIPAAALKFVSLLLRLQDLILLTPERASSSFREDAIKAIRTVLGDRAVILEDTAISPEVEFPADLIIQAAGREKVAVFLAMSEQRVLEAVVAQMAVTYETETPCSVVALLDRDSTVSRKLRQKASNRLTAMPIFEGDEKAAVQRIEREVLGRQRAA
ncbi:DUF1828 domain-containing protein [Rhizomicrobium electricum]|uniref:DUF1828 domain-containing protein n=1 Tax=Rhizomicrobium electricum TaxID=480070 RepID=A0ABN1E6I9_9PROT|nr:DUF1828 domain-containing protein [Rhizomicrobium electricum]NIJ47791.1 hypothetical protein [Rhizomicrobium electricum]